MAKVKAGKTYDQGREDALADLMSELDIDDLDYLKEAVVAFRKPKADPISDDGEIVESVDPRKPLVFTALQFRKRIEAARNAGIGSVYQSLGVTGDEEIRALVDGAKHQAQLTTEVKELRAYKNRIEADSVQKSLEIVIENAPGDRGPGHPTSYSPEIVNELEKYVKEGLSIKDSALLAGINPDTVYEWQKRHPEFSGKMQKASAEFKRANLAAIRAASYRAKKDDKSGETKWSGQWPANAWLLERKHPEEFGQGLLIRVQVEQAALLQKQKLSAAMVWDAAMTLLTSAVKAQTDFVQMVEAISANMAGNSQALALPGLIIHLEDSKEDDPK